MQEQELLRLASLASGFDNLDIENDGDALRIAVKLNFLVQIRATVTIVTDCEGRQLSFRPHKPHGNNPYAATRYAIFRAAAELVKNPNTNT